MPSAAMSGTVAFQNDRRWWTCPATAALGFAIVACTCTLRVATSIFGLIEVTFPAKASPVCIARDLHRHADRKPGDLLRQEEIDIDRIDRLQGTSLSPGFRNCPGFTVVMPSLPANGARIVFFATGADCCSASARLPLRSAASPSIWAWLTACTSSWALSRSERAASRRRPPAHAAARYPIGIELYQHPHSRYSPDLKPMERTRPAISVVTSTPRTARKCRPRQCGCHCLVARPPSRDGRRRHGARGHEFLHHVAFDHVEADDAAEQQPHRNQHDHHAFFHGSFLSMSRCRASRLCRLRDRARASYVDAAAGSGRRHLAVPPATAQRLKQRRDVGVACGLRLHQRDARLLVLALRNEQREIAHRAELVLALREVERSRRAPRPRPAPSACAHRRPARAARRRRSGTPAARSRGIARPPAS